MEFASHDQTAAFHSPLADFEAVEKTVEVREDPLTGRTARIAEGSLKRTDSPDIEPVVADSEGCFFCPGNVAEATPTYPDWMDETRGSRGEATSFPNLTPYGTHSNVVALTEAHFQPMAAFTPRQFADGFSAALTYVRAAMDHDPEATVASVNMNFLRSAGSSIIHPHMQAIVDDTGMNHHRALLDASRAYRDENGSRYWTDLRAAERDGDRWIGSTGEVDWLAAFAPKHHRHALGVTDARGVDALDRETLAALADGLTDVLGSYADAGLNAFNFALYLPDEEATPAMPPVLSVVARSVFDDYYWSDSPYYTVLHDEAIVHTTPESTAADVRDRR